MSNDIFVAPDKLTVGMYVRLDLSWLEHPFPFGSFVIRNDKQLEEIRQLGLPRVRVDPLRSRVPVTASAAHAAPGGADADPGPAGSGQADADMNAEAPQAIGNAAGAIDIAATAAPRQTAPEKLARLEWNRRLRSEMVVVERQAAKAAGVVRGVSKQIFSEPKRAVESANGLITDIASVLLDNSDVMIHLLNDKVAGEETYYHALNVTMLSLLLGKALRMSAAELQTIGVGTIFHDIGKEEVPYKILAKTEPLTGPEEEFLRQHVSIGTRMGREAGLPDDVVKIISQHHERMDGGGYPDGLKGAQITPAARLVAIVNHYDTLCNPVNPAAGLTPYEALSLMFAKRKDWFDPAMLGKLIQVLGVYPPGSVVKLSDGGTGMVLSVNSDRPLRPTVLVYDQSVPREEAIIIDLEQQPDLNISKAIRPATLTRAVYDYLSPRKRVTYYFNDQPRGS